MQTFFIDPPYQLKGRFYTFNKVNYQNLKDWILNLNGQILVCENENADWLDFEPFMAIKSTCSDRGILDKSKEALFYRLNISPQIGVSPA